MAEAAREEEEEPTRKDPYDARSVQISDRETRQLPITHTEGKMLLPSNKGELSPSKSTHCQLEISQEIPQLFYKGETSQPFNTQIHSEMSKSSNTHKQQRISSLSDTLKVSGNFQFPSMHIQRDFCQSLKTHSEESTPLFPNTHSKRGRTQSPVTHDQDGTSHPPNTQSQGDSSLALNIDTWTDSRKKESVTQSNSATAVDVPRTLSLCSTKASDMVTHTHTPPKPRMSRKLSADNPRIVSARTTRSTNSSIATSVSSRKDQKEKAPCRSVISNNAMDQLSMISVRIRSAEDKKTLLGSSRRLTLLERRGHITLAPTRHGLTMGKDHTASWCPDDALEKSTEDSVSSADIMDSSGESLNSSLEVAFSSQEEIDVSEESISQVTLYSSQEPVSSGQEEMNTCQKCHIVNIEHLHNSRDNFCNRQENTDVSKEDTGCNPASLSVRQGGDDRLAALHCNRAGIPVCHEDATRNICDMMETPTDVFIKQEAMNTNHELITQRQADVCDGEGSDSLTDESSCSKHVTAEKLPPTTNCTFGMSTAQNTMMPGNQNLLNNSSSSQRNASSDGESRSSLQATDAGHGCQESRQQDDDKTRQNREFSASGLVEKRPAQNPNFIQLSNETENNTRWEMMVLLHAEQHRQKSANRMQSSTPSPRLIQQTASQFQQRTSSPYQNVPNRRVGTKNQGVSTQAYKQATSHLKQVAKNRALGMFTSPRPDGETNTAYELNLCQRGGSSSSATFNKRDRAGSQTSQKIKPSRASFIPREPLTRSSSSPVHPKTYSIQTQGSPRKGVPNQHPQGSLVLVYQDMDTMMVVGNECRHRPHTLPSHVTSTLRCSPRRQLNQQTRLLPNPRQGGVRVIMHPHSASPTPPLMRTQTEDMKAEGVVAVMETPRYNSSGPNHDNVGGQDQTVSIPLQSCLLGVGGKKCTFSPRPDSVG